MHVPQASVKAAKPCCTSCPACTVAYPLLRPYPAVPASTACTMAAAGEVPEAQLTKLLDPHVDRRTKQHIEVLRCLGLVESVVTPENGASPVPLAPTVASRLAHTHMHTELASPTCLQCTGVSIAWSHPVCPVCTAQTYMQCRCTAALLWLCRE